MIKFLTRAAVFRRLHRAILLQTARHAARQQNWPAAVDRYRVLLTIKNNLPEVWLQLGHARKEMGRIAEAAAAYRYALMLDPDLVDAAIHLNGLPGASSGTDAGAQMPVFLPRPRSTMFQPSNSESGWRIPLQYLLSRFGRSKALPRRILTSREYLIYMDMKKASSK